MFDILEIVKDDNSKKFQVLKWIEFTDKWPGEGCYHLLKNDIHQVHVGSTTLNKKPTDEDIAARDPKCGTDGLIFDFNNHVVCNPPYQKNSWWRWASLIDDNSEEFIYSQGPCLEALIKKWRGYNNQFKDYADGMIATAEPQKAAELEAKNKKNKRGK